MTLTKTVLVEWGLGWGKCLTGMGLKRVGGAELSTANADDCFRNFRKKEAKNGALAGGGSGIKESICFFIKRNKLFLMGIPDFWVYIQYCFHWPYAFIPEPIPYFNLQWLRGFALLWHLWLWNGMMQ